MNTDQAISRLILACTMARTIARIEGGKDGLRKLEAALKAQLHETGIVIEATHGATMAYTINQKG